MSGKHSSWYICDAPECEAKIQNHYWGKVRAHSAGWMIQKNNTVWCPEHLPAWVVKWRERQKEQR